MKDHKETLKTIAITILVTANLAFFAGIWYSNQQQNHIKAEVNSQINQLKAELPSTENQ